jgi:hypothetical protein
MVAQPQVDARLTARLQLRSCRPPLASKRRAELRVSGAPGHGVISRVPGWRPTSDALCHAPVLR